MSIVIYHNPDCGTSRNTLALIRHFGLAPQVVEYLKTPPTRSELADLIARAGLTIRAVLRKKGAPYAELGLNDPTLSDGDLLDAMMAHPILINRPLVVTPKGVALCRPSGCRHRSVTGYTRCESAEGRRCAFPQGSARRR